MTATGFRLLTLVLICASVACSQPTAPQGSSGRSGSGAATPSGRTMVAAVKVEPATIAARPMQEAAGTGLYLTDKMFNASIALLDWRGVPIPYLVESLPQLNTESWQLLPDGRMVTTFQLKPDLFWHDGAPLTSDDFVFAWQIYARPDLGLARRLPMDVIESVAGPDPRTIVFTWKRAYPDAASLTDRNAELPPLPRHILQQQFDDAAMDLVINNPYWHREFVGAGPYKLDRWEPGTFLEASSFDRHGLGKAKIGKIKLMFIGDSQTVIANLISGDVHLAAIDAVRLEQALTLMRDWERSKAGGMTPHPNQWRAIFFQFRPDYVNPRSLLNPNVRKALAHAVDRVSINEAVYGGVLELADSMISAKSEWAEAVNRVVNRYPLDMRRSEQLMTEAGFTRGADGFYTNPTEGRFTTEVKTNGASDNEQEMTILAATWREAGYNVLDAVLPIAQAQNNEVRATYPGMFSNNGPLGEGALLNQATTRIPSPENRWNGSNRGGWPSPEYDRLLDGFSTTLDRTQRAQIAGQMVALYTEEVSSISLFFRVQPWIYVAPLKGLERPAAPETLQSWNIHEWELLL